MLQQQAEKIKESQKNRAYHEEKIKKALEKNDNELVKKREVIQLIALSLLLLYKNYHVLNKKLIYYKEL